MVGLLLLACAAKVGNPTEDLVVLLSVDTLGQAAARDTDWCGHLTDLFGEYDLTVACLDGAVSPASWTGEAHTRVLFPSHLQGSGRALHAPACGAVPLLGTVQAQIGGRYLFGSDNMVLSSSGMESCTLTQTQWAQGTDRYDDTHEEPEVLALIDEADRPVHHMLDAWEREVRSDGAVELFLNVLEPGGHEPRCWMDPETPACDELWDVAASHGIWEPDADRRDTWLDPHAYAKFQALFGERLADEELRWRDLFWRTTTEAITYHRATFFDDRLRRVLDATRDAGRLGDLHVVIFGDHGENPCVARGLGDANLNCGHNGIPTEFTALVPVFVSPASMAEEWEERGFVGDDARPWSTGNLGFGLAHTFGAAPPAEWGEMEPPGSATSWTCKTPEASGGASGIRVQGQAAIRCIAGVCEATSFVLPTAPTALSAPVDPAPEGLQAWMVAPDWFTEACVETGR